MGARELRFWSVGVVILGFVLWLISDVLLPFVAAMVIAYVFAPLVDRLAAVRVPRPLGALVALVVLAAVIVAVVLLVMPVLQVQIGQLSAAVPEYAERLRTELSPMVGDLLGRLSAEDVEQLRTAAGNHAAGMISWVGDILASILTGSLALFDVVSVIFITPVVAFYLLVGWPAMLKKLRSWLPRDHETTILAQVAEVDRTLGGFIYGQAAVCFILGSYYALALTLLGLDFAAAVGLIAGLVSFIPYVGSLFGLLAATGLALAQFSDLWWVAATMLVMAVGQTVEGYYLQPNLVGDRVGLHPVWVMFALVAGGKLYGFAGVLLAVPVAAVLGVGVRFAIGRYLESSFYRASPDPSAPSG